MKEFLNWAPPQPYLDKSTNIILSKRKAKQFSIGEKSESTEKDRRKQYRDTGQDKALKKLARQIEVHPIDSGWPT